MERFESWSATSTGTWETKNLGGAPFNVPADAVVEVALRNSNTTLARLAGVRAVGSTLQRRFDVHAATQGGHDVVTMHVQTNASSEIEHYAENTADVDFVLLGYWTCGTYVERFDLFNASASWTDQDLYGFGVGPSDLVEIVMVNEHTVHDYYAGVRTNGSTLDRRVVLQPSIDGTDAVTMIVQADNSASATIESYARHVEQLDFYLVGYWSAPPGNYTETFVDLGSPLASGAWEDVDLASFGVPAGNVAEILLVNDDPDEEDEMGIRSSGSSVERLLNLRQANDGAGDFGRMHVLSDASAIVEFRHQDVLDAHRFYLLGYWDVGVILSDHSAGQQPDAFTGNGGETDAELFAFDLTPCSGTLTVTEIILRLSDLSELTDASWSDVELIVDTNSDGDIGIGESTSVGGTGVVNQAAGTITFSSAFDLTASTSYILRADFAWLSIGAQVTIGLDQLDISASQSVTGWTTSVTHQERIYCYVERFATWTASASATWETKSLAGAPFEVPANATVEIAVQNTSGTSERWAGVRAVDSGLDRRLPLHEARGGGTDVSVMHVPTDASSRIQQYAEVAADVDFALLGYWQCGTYVERFDTFKAGADGSWQDRPLCSFGVGAHHVVEIVMTNDDPDNEHEAGIRANDSVLERRINLHEAGGGGVDAATMFVEADVLSTIEVYAQSDADVDFYLVGSWSTAPLAYVEMFTDVGRPASNSTWTDLDLTPNGIADTVHVEFVLSKADETAAGEMGIRENESSLSRILDLGKAQNGGADLGRMHIASDVTATIEFYQQDVGAAGGFYLVGSWGRCFSAVSYVVTDLGAITSANSSLGLNINDAEHVAGFEEDASGNPTAWFVECALTSLGTLGGSYAEAHGINNADMVVGWSHDATGRRSAFQWTSGGGMVDLGTVSGRTDSEALSVNQHGEIVGTVLDFGSPPSNRLAFLYLPSPAYGLLTPGMHSLGTLGGTQSVGMGINDSGQVVGGAQDAAGHYRPFRWQNGIMTDLGALGGNSAFPDHRAQDINASGEVVGRSYTADGARHAFFWDGGISDLGVLPGGSQSWAFGINDDKVAVGTSDVSGGALRAFVWDTVNGMRNLNNLIPTGTGWTLIRATSINNDGYITGFGTNGSGQNRAFLLTPTCWGDDGGAAAATVLASGSGVTDHHGEFAEAIVGEDGAVLGRVEIVNPEPGIRIDYKVIDPLLGSPASEPAIESVREGFADGIALSRTLSLATTAMQAEYSTLTVSMTFAREEIAVLGVELEDLAIHVLETGKGDQRPMWVPAGDSVGNSSATGVIGDSGCLVDDDGTVLYWTVRASGGTFAVGKAVEAHRDDEPTVDPDNGVTRSRLCGMAMIPPLFGCSMMLLVLRQWRRHAYHGRR